MNIKFKSIALNNFLSFEKAELNLNNNGFTHVMGINKNPDDLAKSNGSGKSSLWEAIAWGMTGETIRGSKEVKRLQASEKDPCTVNLSFDIDNKNYQIIRSKDPTSLKVFVDGKDISGKGIRDTQQILEKELPDLTSSLIGSVIILGQGLPQRFTNNTPSGRKEVLEKLSKSDFMIADLKDRVAARSGKLSSDLRDKEDDSIRLSTNLMHAESEIKRLESVVESTQEIDAIKNQIETTQSEINVAQSDYEESVNKASSLESELSAINDSIVASSNKQNEELNTNEELLSCNKELEEANARSYSQNVELNNARKELERVRNIKDVCPTCGQKLIGVEKPDITPYEEAVKACEANKFSIEDEVVRLREKYSNIKESIINKYRDAQRVLNENKQDINNKYISAKNDVRAKEQVLTNIKTTLNSLTNKLELINKSIETCKADLEKAKQDKINIEEKILYNNNEKDLINRHIEVINKFSTILKRDFRGYLLSGIIDYICSKSKEYSQIVFETDKIDFKLDGNNIDISYDSKPYESLSGGEKQKVDLIVQFAIRDMLCKYLNFSSNILVLDEIFDNLDSKGCQNILNLITTKLNDVESVFIITHHDDISLPCDFEICVEKGEDSISRIV